MADYEDAESPVGERGGSSRAPTRASGPLGKLAAWFGAQPASTKLIIISVILVIGVVIWMALRNKGSASTSSDSSEDKPGKFSPLGQGRPGENGPTGIAVLPMGGIPLQGGVPVSNGDTSNAPSYPPITLTGITRQGPTGLVSPPTQAQSQISQAAAYRPPVTFSITPRDTSTIAARAAAR